MSKGSMSRLKNRKRQTEPKRLRVEPKRGVLANKSTNESTSPGRDCARTPTTAALPQEVALVKAEAAENWPITYLENGDFFVETICSAAIGDFQESGPFGDTSNREINKSGEEFHHYDVLDELLCEQVDPAVSLVPTPRSKEASALLARTTNHSFDWDASGKEKPTITWTNTIQNFRSRLEAPYSRLTSGYWNGKI
ncbi:LADA_0F00793g1_1 [Lachancea dasiensis]|uniref:LADA_0F00793g1_1 n=1 Tax=Lachancea dasiensis TaxID=1072105 RepID=A0A1G4JHR0_9SACH|nr:LADA_0F00793g1_1 [Lachancea dasiensis]